MRDRELPRGENEQLALWQERAARIVYVMQTANEASSNPRVYCENIQRQLTEISDHLRKDIARVDEPQFKALCETSAEVIGALRTSFQHYALSSEPAWQGKR